MNQANWCVEPGVPHRTHLFTGQILVQAEGGAKDEVLDLPTNHVDDTILRLARREARWKPRLLLYLLAYEALLLEVKQIHIF